MWQDAKIRLQILTAALNRRHFKILSLALSAAGLYDLFGAQFIADTIAHRLPTVYEFLVMTSGLLPWWGWALVLMVTITITAVEYSVRQTDQYKLTRHNFVPLNEAAIKTYERSRGTFIARWAEDEPNPDRIMSFYFEYLFGASKGLYGKRLPSEQLEKLPGSSTDYGFRVKDGIVEATERSGKAIFSDLCIEASDLIAVLKDFEDSKVCQHQST